MGSMFNIFRRQPTVPDPVPTDRIIPIHYFDNTLIFTTFVMSTMFVFDDVLDAQKLHSCLERLVERDGWGKLGARLRKNVRHQDACVSRIRTDMSPLVEPG